MAQAITVTYFAPTDTCEAKLYARSQAKRTSMGWNSAQDRAIATGDKDWTGPYRVAAMAHAQACGWDAPGEWAGGWLPDGAAVFVWQPEEPEE